MVAVVLWLSAQGRNASDCQPTEAYLQTASARPPTVVTAQCVLTVRSRRPRGVLHRFLGAAREGG